MKESDSKLLSLAFKIFNKACAQYTYAEIGQGVKGEKEHAETVLWWVKKLTINPSIELQVAAVFHDIDRVVTPGAAAGFKEDRKSKVYLKHKKAHAKRSADYLCPKLSEFKVNSSIVGRIRFLITHHDDIGSEVSAIADPQLDILVAADSFAFFTSVAPKLYQKEGAQRLKDKIRFMIEKMPESSRKLLKKQKLKNKLFDKLKNEAINEIQA